MKNETYVGVFRLFLLITTFMLLIVWSTSMISASLLILPVFIIAIVSILTAKPFIQ